MKKKNMNIISNLLKELGKFITLFLTNHLILISSFEQSSTEHVLTLKRSTMYKDTVDGQLEPIFDIVFKSVMYVPPTYQPADWVKLTENLIQESDDESSDKDKFSLILLENCGLRKFKYLKSGDHKNRQNFENWESNRPKEPSKMRTEFLD
ncbi:hypothetical protein BpHYR1_038157 [Brachionus plicatilis]|uniref:Uncharacterized protein n=1 Tax=Brachionus plicatilis TaxID=10195 RepID=A0A3M7Q392_BRAPC|nr:hypothetical protein BpHYR1_038157 [Brachionus plicatilis]